MAGTSLIGPVPAEGGIGGWHNGSSGSISARVRSVLSS